MEVHVAGNFWTSALIAAAAELQHGLDDGGEVYDLCTAQVLVNSPGEGLYFKFFCLLFKEGISVPSS